MIYKLLQKTDSNRRSLDYEPSEIPLLYSAYQRY